MREDLLGPDGERIYGYPDPGAHPYYGDTPDPGAWTYPEDKHPVPTFPTTTTPAPGTSSGGGGFGGMPNFPSVEWPSLPSFTPPQFQAPPPFQAPGAEGMFADPGYQFRELQGRKALEQSAAAKGVLRTGGTLKDLVGYGQNLASQEYGNVFNRAANAYQTNYGVSRDVFDWQYRGAQDAFAPQLSEWEVKANARQRAAELEYSTAYNRWRDTLDLMGRQAGV